MGSALRIERKEGVTQPGGLGSLSREADILEGWKEFHQSGEPFCKGRPKTNIEFKIPYFYMSGKTYGKGKKNMEEGIQSLGGRREGKRKTTFYKKYEDLTTGWNPLVICSDDIKLHNSQSWYTRFAPGKTKSMNTKQRNCPSGERPKRCCQGLCGVPPRFLRRRPKSQDLRMRPCGDGASAQDADAPRCSGHTLSWHRKPPWSSHLVVTQTPPGTSKGALRERALPELRPELPWLTLGGGGWHLLQDPQQTPAWSARSAIGRPLQGRPVSHEGGWTDGEVCR